MVEVSRQEIREVLENALKRASIPFTEQQLEAMADGYFPSETRIQCIVCQTFVSQPEISRFSAYGGLPSPCCTICFEVNDYRIESIEELRTKSLLRRENAGN